MTLERPTVKSKIILKWVMFTEKRLRVPEAKER